MIPVCQPLDSEHYLPSRAQLASLVDEHNLSIGCAGQGLATPTYYQQIDTTEGIDT